MLTKQCTQLLNQLHSLLYTANPELLSYCRDGMPAWVLKLLLKYPTAAKLKKARELGIPAGPLYKRLQSGQEVGLADGRVVKPEEVLGPPRPGRKVVYMVDTRPFPEGVEFARGADLLIHDGMFDDEMAEEGRLRGHSTTQRPHPLQ